MKNSDFEKMPDVSDYSSRKGWEEACWQKILESKKLLDLITTTGERCDFARRAAAMKSLANGKSYRKIADELWLSLQTISSIKKIFRENAYRSYSERSKKERKRRMYSYRKTKPKPAGRPHRTKYGTVYLPY